VVGRGAERYDAVLLLLLSESEKVNENVVAVIDTVMVRCCQEGEAFEARH
jgi:hypothetical protein